MSDFIREIDEDLRRENLEKLWRKYGIYALGLAVVIVLAIAAYTGWRHYSENYRVERAREYESALQLVAAGDAKAADALAALATDDDGYAALAKLQAAALKAKAQEILTGLADDLNAPQGLRQRATAMLAALKG